MENILCMSYELCPEHGNLGEAAAATKSKQQQQQWINLVGRGIPIQYLTIALLLLAAFS